MKPKGYSFAPIPVRGETKNWLDVFNKKHRTKYTSLKEVHKGYHIKQGDVCWYVRKKRFDKGADKPSWIMQILAKQRDRALILLALTLAFLLVWAHITHGEQKEARTRGFVGEALSNISPVRFYEWELKKLEPKPVYAKETVQVDKEKVKELIIQYFGEDAEWALRVAKCESGYNPKAANKTSTARGVFQIIKGTWISNRTAMGLDTNLDLRFDAEENIKTAKYIFDRRGTQPWVCK